MVFCSGWEAPFTNPPLRSPYLLFAFLYFSFHFLHHFFFSFCFQPFTPARYIFFICSGWEGAFTSSCFPLSVFLLPFSVSSFHFSPYFFTFTRSRFRYMFSLPASTGRSLNPPFPYSASVSLFFFSFLFFSTFFCLASCLAFISYFVLCFSSMI